MSRGIGLGHDGRARQQLTFFHCREAPMRTCKSHSPLKTRPTLSSPFMEDGARSFTALDAQERPFWRLGALVFQPDIVRKSHQVSHSLGMETDSSLGGLGSPDLLAAGRTSASKRRERRTGLVKKMDLPRKRDAGGGRPAGPPLLRQPDPPYIPLQRRSGCIPAEPYPPLRQS